MTGQKSTSSSKLSYKCYSSRSLKKEEVKIGETWCSLNFHCKQGVATLQLLASIQNESYQAAHALSWLFRIIFSFCAPRRPAMPMMVHTSVTVASRQHLRPNLCAFNLALVAEGDEILPCYAIHCNTSRKRIAQRYRSAFESDNLIAWCVVVVLVQRLAKWKCRMHRGVAQCALMQGRHTSYWLQSPYLTDLISNC